MPGKSETYFIRHGGADIILKVAYVNSVTPCGPRFNIDLTYNVRTTFDYYCSNYAIVVLPSQILGDKIVYVRHFLAEIGGESTRRCGRCVFLINDSRPYYDVGCKKPENCRGVPCCMQTASLKPAASEIVSYV